MWAGRDASNRIIGYYSYLFTFPRRWAMVSAIAIVPPVVCAISFMLIWGPSAAAMGLIYGFLGLTVPILASDAMTVLLFREEALFSPRKITILSYASCIVYSSFIVVSSIVVSVTGYVGLLTRAIMFAVAMNASMRYLAMYLFSTSEAWKNCLAAFAQPSLCLIASVLLLPTLVLRVAALGVLGVAIMVAGARILLRVMEGWKGKRPGLMLLPLFRSFILAWSEGVNGPLEDQIAQIGETQDVEVDTLVFRDDSGANRAAVSVPYIHPGPFRNVGSSALPQVLAVGLGEILGCPVIVSHGVSTHEGDMTRSTEMEKVVRAVSSELGKDDLIGTASPLVRHEKNGAKASCQMFGKVALVSLTLSPKSYDDIPEELGDRIKDAADAMGVAAIVVDSHNSIRVEDEINDSDVENLFEAAIKAIGQAKASPQQEFLIGTSNFIPPDWGLAEGMGPSGIASFAVRLGTWQTSVYVVVDGNNMISGLREMIIENLKSNGFDDAEAMTSDTHVVNALGATSRGYSPIGERTDKAKFLSYVLATSREASSKLETCKVSHTRTMIRGLGVLGKTGLDTLSDVLDSAFSLFKRTAILGASASIALTVAVIFLL